jgi:uncharacterized protein YqeY
VTTLKETLKSDLTAAMKAGDETVRGTLRMALAAVTNAEVAGDEAVELSDDQVVAVLQERAELAVLERYLPAAMSEAEIAAIVAEEVAAAAAAGNSGPKAMGTVVKAVRARVGASADGSVVANLVKAALA